MTQIFFYHGAEDKIGAAAHLLGKACVQKKRVLVFAPDKTVAQAVDRSLWTQSALSFLPHCTVDSPLAAETPILIADNLEQPPLTERLMNLGHELPPGFERFASLIEVVGTADDDRAAARERVLRYKAAGCDVRYFDLSAPH